MTGYNLIYVLILLPLLVMVGSATPMAQHFVGRNNPPNVVINESVIESLAPRPNLAKRLLQIRGTGKDTNTTGQAHPSNSRDIISNKASSNSKHIVLIPPGPTKPLRYKSKKLKITKTKLPNSRRSKKNLVKPKVIRGSNPQRRLPAVLEEMIAPKPPQIIEPKKKVIINTAETKKNETPVSAAIIPPAPIFINRQKNSATASTKSTKSLKKTETIVSALPSKQKDIKSSSKSTIKFKSESSSLDSSAITILSNILKVLKQHKSYSVQLSSYANSRDSSAIQARRISLSRALSARSHLIKNGIGRTRVEVRALGNNFGNEYPNRIDIVVRKR